MALKGAALTAWKRKHPALVERWGRKKKRKKHKRHHPKKEKKMAKKRRRGRGKRRGGGRGRGGGLFALSKKDLQAAAAAAGAYTYIAASAAEKPADYEWFAKLPVINSVGRAATCAIIAGAAYSQGIARKWSKPIAIGTGFVALVNLGRRKFKLYDSEEAGRAFLSGEDGEDALSGDVDLEYEAA